MPSSPLPTRSAKGSEMSENGWESRTSVVEWGAKGQGFGSGNERGNGLSRYGAPTPVSPLPRLPVGSIRDTLRVFPNAREKLGGKELPKDF